MIIDISNYLACVLAVEYMSLPYRFILYVATCSCIELNCLCQLLICVESKEAEAAEIMKPDVLCKLFISCIYNYMCMDAL